MNSEINPVIKAAQDYQRASAQYVTMRHLGTLLGVSSHAIGRKLMEVGLRTPERRPSEKAKESGLTKTVFVEQGFALDLWHLEKTLTVLRPLIEPK
jgi:hypothetical protein